MTTVLGVIVFGAALASVIRGVVRHHELARRAKGWLPAGEVAQQTEAARWRQAWQNAAATCAQLQRHEVPQTLVPFDVMTRPNQQVFLEGVMLYERHYGTDATYIHRSGAYFGHPLFVAVGLASSAIGNANARPGAT